MKKTPATFAQPRQSNNLLYKGINKIFIGPVACGSQERENPFFPPLMLPFSLPFIKERTPKVIYKDIAMACQVVRGVLIFY